MAKLAVKMDKKSPINCIDQHTKTLGFSFTKRVTPVCAKDVLTYFKFEHIDEFKPFLGTLFAYFGDFHLACKVQPLSPFLLRLLYSALKVVIALIDKLKEVLKDFELKTVSDVTLIQKTTERLNVVYLNKYLL
jgi:hypothetical protein